MLTREDCLTILEEAIESPPGDPPLGAWVADNLDSLEAAFGRTDFLKIKLRGLLGAREVLERHGRIEKSQSADALAAYMEEHCRRCGEKLFRAIPGKTTREEIVAFAELIGDEQIKADQWMHPGVYCPNGCTCVLFNYRRQILASELDGGSVEDE